MVSAEQRANHFLNLWDNFIHDCQGTNHLETTYVSLQKFGKISYHYGLEFNPGFLCHITRDKSTEHQFDISIVVSHVSI